MTETTAPPTIATVRLRPPPLPWHEELLSREERFLVPTVGRRGAKTTGGLYKLLQGAVNDPGAYWWVAPSYQQAWRPFRALLAAIPPKIRRVNRSQGRLEVFQSEIEFKSAEKYHNLRGEGLKGMVIDECPLVPRIAWEEVLQPMLLDFRAWGVIDWDSSRSELVLFGASPGPGPSRG